MRGVIIALFFFLLILTGAVYLIIFRHRDRNAVNKLLKLINDQEIKRIIIIDSDNGGYIKEFVLMREIKNITEILNSVSYSFAKKENDNSGGWGLSVRFITKENNENIIYVRDKYVVMTDEEGNNLVFSIKRYNLNERIYQLIYSN